MRTTEDDGDVAASSAVTSARPAWMNALKARAEEWLSSLPTTLTAPPSETSPLARLFARECSTGQRLLKKVRQDLEDLKGVCSGDIKQTNELRALLSDLNRGK